MKIIFFDGTCAMCHWAIKWVAKHDSKKVLFFAPLQGKTAEEKLAGLKLPDSIVFYDEGAVSFYAKACFTIAWELGGIWATIGLLSFLPNWLLFPANIVYRFIAKRRSLACDITISLDRLLP